ncbi:Protein PLASTID TRANSCRIPTIONALLY ACTIVE 16 [Cardamine amara subsp. amara]|uniref:Protein PLASTID TRANSCRIPTIONALLY ACTIVE 16 n=1 Tax=Cardamine amara subsp. amara TaxID=228776 RepID=A0ABD1BSR8_CARAN
MASTSTSFPLTTTPPQGVRFNRRKPRLTVWAKKTKGDDDSEGKQTGKSSDSNPFRFNFGKLPDMKSLMPVVTNPSAGLAFGNTRRKDPGTVFVAGATGQAGIRIAQTLLQRGFSVRAGVPDLGAAQDLARVAATYKILSKEEVKNLNAVQSPFQDAESIAKAIGNATKVVVTVGATENGPDAQVSTSDALLVVQAAELAGVSHVAIVYDGSNSGSTYNVLDGITSFFSNLFSQSQPLTISDLIEKVAQTNVAYTLIKTRLTEDFTPEKSYNVVVSPEGSNSGGNSSSEAYKVPKLKIASLVADIFANTAVAENKVVEVSTDPSAPLRPLNELFSAIPEDRRRKVYADGIAKARAEEEAKAAAEKAQEAAVAAQQLEKKKQKRSEKEAEAAEEKAEGVGITVDGLFNKAKDIGSGFSWTKLGSQISEKEAEAVEEVQEKAEGVGITVDGLFSKAKDIGSGLSWTKLGSQINTAVQNASETPKVQVATVRGQAKARNLAPKKAVVKQRNVNAKPAASVFASKQKEDRQKKPEKEVRKVFGGLFKQETIYIDDD